ncbi:hypothetical protein MWH28_06740 [Natroniella sulfidigena]|uniref:hypothetical protein n=1 Tax=Natroniella sulfidigena TaxID=723921 RepID=UPI00200B229E|nr:hypothetical protein [Natroniella sulfidigena]MCK8817069.1 hypothetical protein [Natroniella sulfidigena]
MEEDADFLEELLEKLMIELLESKGQPTRNPPTPSLNDFSEVDSEDIDLSAKDADQLLKFLTQALKRVDFKEEALTEEEEEFADEFEAEKGGQEMEDEAIKIRKLGELNSLKDKIHRLEKELEEVKQDKQQVITKEDDQLGDFKELQEELKELRDELIAVKEEKAESSSSRDRHDFKAELKKHVKNFDFVKLIIITGDSCCEIIGALFEIYSDFVIVLANGNRLIKVPIKKIAALEKIKTKKKRKKDDKSDSDDQSSTQEQTSQTMEDYQEEADTAAKQEEQDDDDELEKVEAEEQKTSGGNLEVI